jgi:DNA-binding XRE family transcriptional regulator
LGKEHNPLPKLYKGLTTHYYREWRTYMETTHKKIERLLKQHNIYEQVEYRTSSSEYELEGYWYRFNENLKVAFFIGNKIEEIEEFIVNLELSMVGSKKTKFSNKVRNYRKKNGYTQGDLAKITDRTQQVISYIEQGKFPAKVDDIIPLLSLFGVTFDEIFSTGRFSCYINNSNLKLIETIDESQLPIEFRMIDSDFQKKQKIINYIISEYLKNRKEEDYDNDSDR